MSVSVSQKNWGLPQICLEIAEMRQEQLVIFVGAAWNFGLPESGDTPKIMATPSQTVGFVGSCKLSTPW